MERFLALIVLLPLLAGAVIAVAGSRLPRRFCEVTACGAVVGAFASSLAAFLSYRRPVAIEVGRWLSAFDLKVPFSLAYDPLAAVMCLMVTFVSGLILIYSTVYMAKDAGYARFFSFMSLFVGAMLLLVLAGNLPLLFLGWEGVGFCSYGLIGFWYRDEKNADAGRKAFLVTRIGDVAFAAAIFWLFALTGVVSITAVNGMAPILSAGVVTSLGLLLLFGAMGKSAQMPLMVWLPDAMAGPTPVSALIHAATMVTAGVYLLIRFFPLIGGSTVVCAAIAVTGAVTAFYAATCALAQRDLKRILAYSTMSQIGYMMLGVGSGALSAATFHLVEHSFYKALLFLGAGCVITAMGHEQDIFRMGGLRRSLPGTFWPFLAGAACLAGLPPTGGFLSKDAILAAVHGHGGVLYQSLYILGIITVFLTALYTFRMFYVVFGGEGPAGGKAPRIMEVLLVPLAILGLFGGAMNFPGYLESRSFLDGFLQLTVTDSPPVLSHSTELILQLVSAVAAAGGLLLARHRYGGGRWRGLQDGPLAGTAAFLSNGWYFDDLYRVVFLVPFEKCARILGKLIEEKIIFSFPERLGEIVARSGEVLGKWSHGRVSLYLTSFAAGAALLLVWVMWTLN
jgi:NADH-quinone oxidoreductase subunit L